MILISLGSNLPGRFGSSEEAVLEGARAMTARGLKVVQLSRLWLTAPVPVSDDPWYVNAAAAVETELSPRAVFTALKEIEKDFGRGDAVRNASRVLDLDLLVYHDEQVHEPRLTLPHLRMHERAFVLYPLKEIAPAWRHPVLDKSVDELIAALPPGQEMRVLGAAA